MVPRLVVLLLLAACSDSPRERCLEQDEVVEGCGWVDTGDPCETSADRCRTACYSQQSCGALDRYFERVEAAPELLACLGGCVELFVCEDDGHEIPEVWVCDTDRDCVDGSDERDCAYFPCFDGRLLPAWEECDGVERCEGGEDEAGC